MSNAGEMDLGRESAKGFVANAGQALLGFIGTIIFARLLGPTNFGGFYLLLTIVLFSNRSVTGITKAAKKRYSEHNSAKSEIVGAVLISLAVLGVIFSALTFAFRGYLYELTNVDGVWIVATLLFFTITVFFIFQQLLSADGRLGLQIWVDAVRSVFTLPFQLGLVFIGYSAAGMGYGLAGASLIAAGVAAYLLHRQPSLPTRETVFSIYEYAKYSVPTLFIGKAYGRLDILLIGFLLSAPAAVGQYEVAFKLTMPATLLYTVVFSGMMAKVSNHHSKDEAVAPDIREAFQYASLLPVPIFFGCLALSEELVVAVYGSEYAAAASLLVGLAVHRLIASHSELYQSVLDGIDRPDTRLRINTVAITANLLIGIPLVLSQGPIGAVIATIVAESIRLLISLVVVRQNVDALPLLPRPLIAQLAAGGIMFACVELGARLVGGTGRVRVFVLVAVGALVYTAALLAISPRFRQMFKPILTTVTNR